MREAVWSGVMLGALAALAAAEGDPAAVDSDRASTRVSVRISVYDQPDPGGTQGNPFLDEALTVIEPVLIVEHDVNESLTVEAKVQHDYVSAASIKRLDYFPTQSGASADYYFAGELGARYAVNEAVSVNLAATGSVERDYRSAGGRAGLSWQSADGNTKLSGSLAGLYDTPIKILYNGVNEGSDRRLTLTGTVSLYRAFNGWLHGSLGVLASHQGGYLETPLNPVVIQDAQARPNPLLVGALRGREAGESLPRDRIRGAVYGSLRAWLPSGGSLELGGRYYADSWGIEGASVEATLRHWIVRDLLRARLRYRYYRQEGARYFQRELGFVPRHRTQDPDLARLHSHKLGLSFTVSPTSWWGFDVGVDRVWRSDDLDAWWFTSGIRVEF